MSNDEGRLICTAEHLRGTFDRSFAEALRTEAETFEDLLAIRVGGDPYAIRLSAITGLFTGRRITRLPGLVAELLGVAAFRGTLAPIYDLRMLLGYPGVGTSRWLVMTKTEAVIGLAFDQFDGHLHLPRSRLMTDDRADAARQHVRGVAQTAEAVRPLIHIPSIFDAITTRARHGPPQSRSTKR